MSRPGPAIRRFAGIAGTPHSAVKLDGTQLLHGKRSTTDATSDPDMIRHGVKSGCVGPLSQDMVNPYNLTLVKTKVMMLPAWGVPGAERVWM